MIDFRITDTTQIISPALVVFRQAVTSNLQQMIEIAGDAKRLRPHCKTHKMPDVTRIELGLGITKHKCATFAEAEMLAGAGAKDILLAYNLVGPNIARAVAFQQRFPDTSLLVTADHPGPIDQLASAMSAAGQSIGVLLDLDVGFHRTGVQVGDEAVGLYQRIVGASGLRAEGLHPYDGHNHQTDLAERTEAVQAEWKTVSDLRDRLIQEGCPVPRIVAGGTGTFPVFAAIDDAAIELSPGTCVFHDAGYGRAFPDLAFEPAARILTRVISRPTPSRVTLDLGYKACASDPPAGKRLSFPDLPDAREVLQNEEHLVLETSAADRFQPGDELLAVPTHICPTSALHKLAYVVEDGIVVDQWEVAARDRRLTI